MDDDHGGTNTEEQVGTSSDPPSVNNATPSPLDASATTPAASADPNAKKMSSSEDEGKPLIGVEITHQEDNLENEITHDDGLANQITTHQPNPEDELSHDDNTSASKTTSSGAVSSASLASPAPDKTESKVSWKSTNIQGTTSAGSWQSTQLTNTSSDDSVVCRICQLSQKDTGLELTESGCGCKGSIRKCHEQCLLEWVRTRLNTRCELCDQLFSHVTLVLHDENGEDVEDLVPEPRNDEARNEGDEEGTQRERDEREARRRDEVVLNALAENRIPALCGDPRRAWFFIIICILAICSFATLSLSIYIRKDYSRAWEQAWARGEVGLTEMEVQNYQFSYGLAMALMSFCFTLLISVSIMWCIAEFYFWPQEASQRRRWLEMTQFRRGGLYRDRHRRHSDNRRHHRRPSIELLEMSPSNTTRETSTDNTVTS